MSDSRHGSWLEFWICPCGFVMREYAHGICPVCGESRQKFRSVVGRRVLTSTWWKPWTWGRLGFEEKK